MLGCAVSNEIRNSSGVSFEGKATLFVRTLQMFSILWVTGTKQAQVASVQPKPHNSPTQHRDSIRNLLIFGGEQYYLMSISTAEQIPRESSKQGADICFKESMLSQKSFSTASGLKSVSIVQCYSNDWSGVFWKLARSWRVQHMAISNTQLHDVNIYRFEQMVHLKHLELSIQLVDAGNNSLSEQCFEGIQKLKGLRYLSISKNVLNSDDNPINDATCCDRL